MKVLSSKKDINEFYYTLQNINTHVIEQMLNNYDENTCYTHIHIDIDMFDDSVNTVINRSEYNAQ